MPQQYRNNFICVILGKRGTGKSYYTINSLLPGYTKSHPNKRIIIFDMNDHGMYKDVPKITLDMLPRWKKEVGMYRICSADAELVFEYIDKYVRNSLILFEDATNFFDNGKTPREIKRVMIDAKQKNNDLVFQFHGFTYAPPLILRTADVYTLFKCDGPDFRKNELVGYHDLKKTWDSVMANPNPYTKKTVVIR
jgi:hypothetical protein